MGLGCWEQLPPHRVDPLPPSSPARPELEDEQSTWACLTAVPGAATLSGLCSTPISRAALCARGWGPCEAPWAAYPGLGEPTSTASPTGLGGSTKQLLVCAEP